MSSHINVPGSPELKTIKILESSSRKKYMSLGGQETKSMSRSWKVGGGHTFLFQVNDGPTLQSVLYHSSLQK